MILLEAAFLRKKLVSVSDLIDNEEDVPLLTLILHVRRASSLYACRSEQILRR